MVDRAERQAVVVIHGIGEQRPMDTLRSLLRGLSLGRYYNKRDRASNSTELRRLSLPRTRHRPATDFFELYWSHQMAPGHIRETAWWALRLAFSRTSDRTSPQVRTLMLLLRIFTVIGVLSMLALGYTLTYALAQILSGYEAPQPQTRAVGIISISFVIVATAINTTAGSFIRRAVADAARYLTPRPLSISGRNAIRVAGTDLLRNLHNDGSYVRIVIVGHSLGSVIAYDILREAFDELRHPAVEAHGPQPEALTFGSKANSLNFNRDRKDVEAFQQAQLRLWKENRERGVPWLVTDLITLGSPLTHAKMLLDQGDFSLRERQDEGEYPTCPPTHDVPESGGFYSHVYSGSGIKRSMFVANAGSVFASTRWTNLYFPARKMLLGDLVGGPLAPIFGNGIKDAPLKRFQDSRREWWRAVFPFPHLDYWRPGQVGPQLSRHGRNARRRQSGFDDALPMLRHSLSLDIRRGKPWPPAAGGSQTAASTAPLAGSDAK